MAETAAASAQTAGRFHNPWPGAAPRRFRWLLLWWLQRLVRRPPPDPPRTAFARVAPRFHLPRAPADALSITWIGHATSLVQLGGRNVLFDPMFSERASPVAFGGPGRWVPPGVPLDGLPPIDAVLLSHNHYDHLDLASVRALSARFPDAIWCAPLRLGGTLRRAGVASVEEFDWWDARPLAGLAITASPAQHFSARHPFDRNRTLWCGWALAAGRHRVFFAGDTGRHPDFRLIGERLGPFDAALLPVGAYEPRWFMRAVHLNPEEAVAAFRELDGGGRAVMVAVHWGTFKLTDEAMDEPPRRTRAAWEAAGLPGERLWIPRHGETREW